VVVQAVAGALVVAVEEEVADEMVAEASRVEAGRLEEAGGAANSKE
jgi:hypothetical protein